MRRRLLDELRTKGIEDERVLQAMDIIPRHFFLDSSFLEWAYEDKAFPIESEQTISQPYTVAYQTELLDIRPREKVLEIGTGSGYQAAILATLGARLYTIERHKNLHITAKKLLSNMGLDSIRFFYRDGHNGLAEYAPFNKIIVTAAAPKVPIELRKQLAIGGVLVIPVGEITQRMYRITRVSETKFTDEKLGKFRFVPFLEGIE